MEFGLDMKDYDTIRNWKRKLVKLFDDERGFDTITYEKQIGNITLGCMTFYNHLVPEDFFNIKFKDLGIEDYNYMIVPYGKKKMFLINGDNSGEPNDLVNIITENSKILPQYSVTVSFHCIARLLNVSTINGLCKKMSEKVTVLGWNKDDTGDVKMPRGRSAEKCVDDIKVFLNKGFTPCYEDFVSHTREYLKERVSEFRSFAYNKLSFHRAGSIVFTDGKYHYLCSMDDDQYFGVKLPKEETPTTVKQALRSLKPKEIRYKQKFMRQGEWFFVEIPEKDIPKNAENYLTCFALPKDHPEGNDHDVTASEVRKEKRGNFYLSDFYIEHPEHPQVEDYGEKWFRLYKNTALQSVSIEGFD